MFAPLLVIPLWGESEQSVCLFIKSHFGRLHTSSLLHFLTDFLASPNQFWLWHYQSTQKEISISSSSGCQLKAIFINCLMFNLCLHLYSRRSRWSLLLLLYSAFLSVEVTLLIRHCCLLIDSLVLRLHTDTSLGSDALAVLGFCSHFFLSHQPV